MSDVHFEALASNLSRLLAIEYKAYGIQADGNIMN